MTPFLAKLAWGLGVIGWFVIRYPHQRRSARTPKARTSDRSRELEFRGPAVRKRHRAAHVDHRERSQVRRFPELTGVETIAPAERLPVYVFQVVAGPIVPVLAELGVEPVKRAPVQALPEPFDRRARQQLQVAK